MSYNRIVTFSPAKLQEMYEYAFQVSNEDHLSKLHTTIAFWNEKTHSCSTDNTDIERVTQTWSQIQAELIDLTTYYHLVLGVRQEHQLDAIPLHGDDQCGCQQNHLLRDHICRTCFGIHWTQKCPLTHNVAHAYSNLNENFEIISRTITNLKNEIDWIIGMIPYSIRRTSNAASNSATSYAESRL